jgi:hypothetical protein
MCNLSIHKMESFGILDSWGSKAPKMLQRQWIILTTVLSMHQEFEWRCVPIWVTFIIKSELIIDSLLISTLYLLNKSVLNL